MEENNLPPGQTVSPSQAPDSLEDAGATTPVSDFSGAAKSYPLQSLEVHAEGERPASGSVYAPNRQSVPFSRRRATIVSLVITLIVIAITGATAALFITREAPEDTATSRLNVPEQDINVGEDSSPLPELSGANNALLINGDIIARGTLRVISGDFTSVVRTDRLTGNQTVTLPDASGTVCLDSNNCNFATEAQITEDTARLEQQAAQLAAQAAALEDIQAQLSQIVIPPAGVTSLNNEAGAVTIQGTLNRVTVSTANGIITLTTPQDLDANADVQFGNLTLGASGHLLANTLQQTGAGSDVNINAGADDIFFTAGGRTFQFPGAGPASQTICTTTVGCGGGGAGVTDLNTLTGSLTIQGTTDQISVAAGGSTITLSTPQNINTTSSPTFAGLTLTTALGVASGGTGVSAVPANGQLLIGNGSGYSLATLSNGGGLTITNGAGSISLAINYGSTAGTAVEGDTALLCASGIGNLAGGGNSVTLGAGGSCNNISIVDNPIFSTSVTTPELVFTGAGSNGTLQVANLGQTTSFVLPDPGAGTDTICLEGLGNCAGSAGITSINGQTGPSITVANATGAGNTITIQDASTAQKGIAQFNAANFTAVGGVINTVQDIGVAATPQFAGMTLTGNLAMGVNSVVGTNFNIDGSTGNITSGLINGQTISAAASFTGTLAIGTLGTANSDTVICRNTATNQLATCNSTFATTDELAGYVQLQGVTPGTAQNGHINVTGTVIGGSFSGDGASLTNLNASNIASGTLNDARLSSNVALLNVAANFTDALQQNGNDVCTTIGNCSGLGQAVDSLNGLQGDLTLQGTAGQITVADNGTDVITLSLDSSVTLQGNTFNGANQLVQLNVSGQLPAISGALLTDLNGSAITTGTVANARLVNGGALTVTAGTGLSGGGSVALGGTTTLNVVYGSTANTAVQGNTALTCPSGTGNLTGGGTAITLGTGGACAALNTVQDPTFATSVTTPQLIFTGVGSNGTIEIANLGQATTYTLPDPAAATATICLSTGNCAGAGGGITGSGTTGTVPVFTNTQEIGDSIITQTGTTIGIAGTLTLGNALGIAYGGTGINTTPTNGQLLIGNGTGYSLAGLTNNGGLTVSNGAGSIGLAVNYGSTANTAVQGNTALTCPSGTGNLTGGGTAITLGTGGTCTALNTVNDPTFSTSVTTPLLTSGGALNITPGGALTVGATTQTTLLRGSTTTVTATGQILLNAGTTIELQDSTNVTGNLSATGTGTFQGASVTVGTASATNGALTLHNSTNAFTVSINAPNQTTGSATLSAPDTAGVDDTICLQTLANCAGTGGGVTSPGGTTNRLTMFTGAQTIGDSWFIQNTSTLELDNTRNLSLLGGDLTLQGGDISATGTISATGDITSDTQLRVLESTGATFYGILDVGDLSSDQTFTFLQGGTVVTSGNVSTFATTGVTAGSGLTGGGTTGVLTLDIGAGNGIQVNANDIAVLYGATASTAVQGNTQITITAGTNLTGGGAITLGAGGTLTVNVADSPTFAGDVVVQGGSLTVGADGQAGTVLLYDGGTGAAAFTGTLQVATLGQNTVYNLPDPGQASVNICLSTGNCAGSGTGVTTSGGTTNRVAKFTGAQNVEDSSISDDGTLVAVNGNVNLEVQGASIAVGVSSTRTGSIILRNSTNANTVTIQSGATSTSYALTLPTAVGNTNQCLKAQNGTGALFWDDCLGGGGGGGITSIDGQTGPSVSINNATGTGNVITIDDAAADDTTKGIAAFNSTNFTATGGVVNTIQDISTTSSPQFSNMTLSGDLAVNGGDITSTGALTITPSGALTVGATTQTTLLRGSTTTVTATGQIILNAGSTIELQDSTNITGNLSATGTGAFQGASVTIGAASTTNGSVILHNATNAFTVSINAPNQTTGSATISAPDTAGANDTICLQTLANCAGTGGGVTTPGGTTNRLTMFTGAQTVGDSWFLQNSSTLELDATRNLSLLGGNLSVTGTIGSTGDITSNTQLRVLESTGATFYGILDVGDLGSDQTFTFLQGGTVVTSGNVSAFATTGVTAGAGLTGGGTTGVLNVDIGAGNGIQVNANDIAVLYGATANTAVQGNTQITVTAGTNITGGGAITLGAGGSVTVNVADSPTFAGDVVVQGGSLTVGADAQGGTLTLYDGGTGISAFTGTLQVATLAQNTTYTLPDPGQANVDICLSTGNCAGSGGGITGSGTTNTIPLFTGSQTIADSIITQSGSTINIAGSLTLTNDLTVANGGTGAGTFTTNGVLYGNGTGALQATAAGTGGQVLLANGSGVPTFTSFSGDVTVSATGVTAIQANSVALGTDTTGDYVANLGALTGLSTTGNTGEGSTPTLSVLYGATANTAVQGNTQITVTAGTNLAGGGTITLGSGGSVTVNTVQNPTFTTSVTTPQLILTGAGSNGTLEVATLGQTTAYNLIDPGQASVDICLSTGNCAGAGGGITGSGTTNTVAKFTGAGTIGDSSITDDGSAVGIGVNTTVTGTFGASGNINTSGGALQTAGTTRVDNTGNLTNIGNITGSGAITIASTGAGNDITIDGADQFIVQDASVFTSDVDFVLNETENITIGNTVTGTNSVSVINALLTNNTSSGTQNLMLLQNAAGSGTTDGLLVLDNADTDTAVGAGIVVTSAAGGITNGIDVSDADITNALLFGANDVIGTNFTIAGGSGAVTGGTYNGQTISSTASFTGTVSIAGATTLQSTLAVQGASATFGTTAQQGSLILHDGNGQTATISVGSALAANTALAIPTGVGASDTFCLLTLNNCAGSGVTTIGTIDSQTKSANGAVISGTSLVLQTADATSPGLVSTGTQTFAGAKTFSNSVTVAAQQTITLVGGTTAQRPVSPSEGMVYYDSTTDKLLTYANGKWQGDRTTATKIVAASNSSQTDKDAADYIADGTGDQTEINAALTAAAGGVVHLMPGTYTVSASVSIPDNTTLSGAGRGTIVQLADLDVGINMIRNTSENPGTGVVVRDMRLNGRNDLNTAGEQIGVYFINLGDGTSSSAVQGGKATGLWIENFRNEGIFLWNADNNIVSNNVIQNSGGGIKLYRLSSNNTVSGNRAQGNTGQGIFLEWDSMHNTITGNTSQGNTSYGFNIFDGSNYSTITGNVAQGNGGSGFRFDSVIGDSVTGNTSQGNTGAGFELQNTTNIALTGNTSQSNTLYGIQIANASNNNVISGNRAHDNGGATTNNGIYMFSSDNNSITDNHITDTSCSTNCFAINVSNATSDTNYLAENTLDTGTINDSGTRTVYGGQLAGATTDFIARFSSTSTTGATQKGSVVTMTDTGVVTTGTDTTYGQQINVNRTGATGGTITTYGLDIQAIGDAGGTSSVTGLNVNVSGADNNYAAVFQGGNVGIGTATPQSALDVVGRISGSAALELRGNTHNSYITENVNSSFIYSSSSGGSGAFSTAGNLIIQPRSGSAPREIHLATGSSSTITSRLVVDSTGQVGIGTTNPDALLEVGNIGRTENAWGLNGIQLQSSASNYTDGSTAASGTATNAVFNSFAQNTLLATNTGVTTTNVATVYIEGASIAGTNQTITNNYALWVDDGASRLDGTLAVAGATTLQSTLAVQGASATFGTTAQQGSLILHDGNGQTATISVGSALAANTALAIPTGVGASDTFCLLTLNNCAGGGGGVTTIGTINSQTKSANGAVITGTSLVMQTADATSPGLVSTGAQTFAGAKTFNGQIIAGAGINLGTQTLQGTTAVINFDNFDVASDGDTTIGGTVGIGTAPTTLDQLTIQSSAGLGEIFISGNNEASILAQGSLYIGFDENDDCGICEFAIYNNGSTEVFGITGINSRFAGSITTGSASQQGSLVLHDGNGQTATISVGSALAANTALAIPTAVGASDTFCLLTLNNCSGTGVSTIGSIDSQTKSANGAVISGSSLVLQTADSGFPGLVSTGTQTFAGAKTFSGTTTTFSGDIALNGGDLTSSGALNITPGGAFTAGVTGQTTTLQGSTLNANSTSGLNIQTSGTTVASFSNTGTMELIQNGFTTTGVSQPIINIDSTITKDNAVESFYAVNFNPTINVTANPSIFGGDVLFRDNSTRVLNTATTFADEGGSVTFQAAPNVQATGEGASTLGNTGSNTGLIGFQSDVFLSRTGASTLTVTNAIGSLLSASGVGAGTTISNRYGAKILNGAGAGAITNQQGIQIDALTKGTNNIGISIGEATGTKQINLALGIVPDATWSNIPSTAYSIYNASTDANFFGGQIQGPTGSAATPSHSFTSDTNTGIYSIGADQLGISTGGTLRLTVSTTGIASALPLSLESFGASGSSTAVCRNGTGGLLGTCTSLSEYKENIQDLDAGLDTINELTARQFDWKADGRADFGFIAEEVAAVNPLLAEYTNGSLSGVKYSQLTALLAKGIQELDVKVDNNTDEITSTQNATAVQSSDILNLSSQSDVLSSQVDTLQTELAAVQSQLNSGQFSSLNVSGPSTFSNITVTGTATIANLVATDAKITHSLTVNGHIITGNSSGDTTAVVGSAACDGTVTINGNDTAGTITIQTGAGVCAAGTMATVNFANTFNTAPRVILTPANAGSASAGYYNGTTGDTSFTIDAALAPAINTTYIYNYHVLQ